MNLASSDVTGILPIINEASPTGTGLAKVSGGAWVSAAATLVDADVSTSAAIQGSKIATPATNTPAALAFDWSQSNSFTKTLPTNGSNTITFANTTDGQSITITLTGAGSSTTVSWPTVKWPGGVAPTQTPSGTDSYTFIKQGSVIYGSYVQAMA